MLMFMLASGALPSAGADPAAHYHTPPLSAPPEFARQHAFPLISPLEFEGGRRAETPDEWFGERRPQIVAQWQRILGKLAPGPGDAQWFGDIAAVEIRSTEARDGYTRIHLGIPIEKDFFQEHLLLLPENQGDGPFPAVIAWTSTSPDFAQPEEWWGAWLARRGHVVLTSWAFIRHYRDGTSYRNGAGEKVYERFGHWLPMAKMVHDVQREVEFLKTRPEVDARRIGFIGFSLSAKTALYVAAFAPEVRATVAIDPHIPLYGATNYGDPWYLDWKRGFPGIRTPDYPVPELRGTVWSLLDADPARPGFERNHHELMALCAPRPLMVIACSTDQESAAHSDDRQSRGYAERAMDVYRLLGIPERFEFVPLAVGHQATAPEIDAAWQRFFQAWLGRPVE